MPCAATPRKGSRHSSRSARPTGWGADAMPLDGFDRLFRDADARPEPIRIAAAGGDDPTVIEALRIAADRGWARPILVGPEERIRDLARSREISLDGLAIAHAEGGAI